MKVEEDRVGLDIGFSREIPLLGEDLPKLKSVWPKEGDELFITLRRDFSGQLFARLATETIISSLYSKAPKLSLIHIYYKHITIFSINFLI